jgi:ATPase subunit of ABC transporter with duplicated ATPase domains
MTNEYVATVLSKLSDNPSAQDLDFFIEAYARVGYLAATAQASAERAEAERRFAEASSYAEAKRNGAKSATDAERASTAATHSYRLDEVSAREKAMKLKNLMLAIEQAINGIKFLNRQTEVMLPRR